MTTFTLFSVDSFSKLFGFLFVLLIVISVVHMSEYIERMGDDEA
jgi:hypothetical protein